MKLQAAKSFLKNYSPMHFIIGSLANFTAERYYKLAKRQCEVVQKPNLEFLNNNVLVSHELENTEGMKKFRIMVAQLYKENAHTDRLISAIKGRYVRGDHEGAEGFYLSEDVLPYDDLLKLIYSTSLFETLQSTFGCEFICRTAAIFKTKENIENIQGSTRFHRDGHPPWNFKILLYITDVDSIDSGPTSYVPGSARSVIPSFGSYRTERHTDRDLYKNNIVLGKSGTALLFNTNGLHAGGRTICGERIVATLQFIPKYSPNVDKFSLCKRYKFGDLEFDII
jgi:hypothetical protein